MLNEPTPAPGTGLTRDRARRRSGRNWARTTTTTGSATTPTTSPRRRPAPASTRATRTCRGSTRSARAAHIPPPRAGILANLRAFPPTGKPGEVWNHGVGKYTARLHAIPGAGPRRVASSWSSSATRGRASTKKDPKPRINSYEYALSYGLDGEVDESGGAACDWIAAGGDAMFAPMNLMEVAESRWQGQNPLVTEANVRSLDLANGGGTGAATRFAGVGRRLSVRSGPTRPASPRGSPRRWGATPRTLPAGPCCGSSAATERRPSPTSGGPDRRGLRDIRPSRRPPDADLRPGGPLWARMVVGRPHRALDGDAERRGSSSAGCRG